MTEARMGAFADRTNEAMDLDRAHEKAQKLIKDESFKEDDFVDLFGSDIVGNDKREASYTKEKRNEELKKSGREKGAKLATLLEGLVLANGGQNEWFGGNAMMLKTSEYDAVKTGVDLIVKLTNETQDSLAHLGLAMDLTIGQDLANRFQYICEEISNGVLRKVKYFSSKKIHFRGELGGLPYVIVGVSAKTISEVADLWMRGKNTELGKHKIQVMILTQIQRQLEFYLEYAKTFSSPEHDILVEAYTKSLKKINEIIESKRAIFRDYEYDTDIGNDESHMMVLRQVKNMQTDLLKSTQGAK